jgi:hypothetical protein
MPPVAPPRLASRLAFEFGGDRIDPRVATLDFRLGVGFLLRRLGLLRGRRRRAWCRQDPRLLPELALVHEVRRHDLDAGTVQSIENVPAETRSCGEQLLHLFQESRHAVAHRRTRPAGEGTGALQARALEAVPACLPFLSRSTRGATLPRSRPQWPRPGRHVLDNGCNLVSQRLRARRPAGSRCPGS